MELLNKSAADYYEIYEEEAMADNGHSHEDAKFVIDTPGKANWAVRVIKKARQRRDMFNSAAEDEIMRIKAKMAENEKRCDDETAFLLSALGEYVETVPAKETKTQKTFALPNGKLKKKFVSRSFKPDKDKLLEYLEGEEEYIRVTREPAWGEFKKLLKEVNGAVVRTDTGEIVAGVVIEEKPASFDIE